MQAAGLRTERQPLADGRFNLLASRGEQAPLLLYAHLDTVTPAADWLDSPFRLRREADRLIGLGCSDMKGGLAALLTAVAATTAPVRLALGVDEEAWSAGAWQLVNSGWCRGAEVLLVPELSIDSPSETLGLGRRGHTGFAIEIEGPRQHGAVPLQQLSAIQQACRLLLDLEQHPLAQQAFFGSEALVIRGLEARSPDFTWPDRCRIEASWLGLPGRSFADFSQELAGLLKQHQARLLPLPRPTPAPAAYAVPATAPAVGWIQARAREIGLSLPLSFGLSVADENVLASLGRPVLSLAPVGGHSHRCGEWVSAASLERVARLYADLIAHGPPSGASLCGFD